MNGYVVTDALAQNVKMLLAFDKLQYVQNYGTPILFCLADTMDSLPCFVLSCLSCVGKHNKLEIVD